jgi:hypothetical protein
LISKAFAPAWTASCATCPSRCCSTAARTTPSKPWSTASCSSRLRPTLWPSRRRNRPAKPSVEKRLELAVVKALQLANGLAVVAVAPK